MSEQSDRLRHEILQLVESYQAEEFPEKPFVPGETPVPVSGKVFDSDELTHLVDASLDFWLTTGRYALQFERQFARYFGLRALRVILPDRIFPSAGFIDPSVSYDHAVGGGWIGNPSPSADVRTRLSDEGR